MEDIEFNITSITDLREGINVIDHYEEIMKTQKKKIIEYAAIQVQMLKKFKDTKDFIKDIGLSRSTVHFKTGLYEIFKKNPVFKN